MRADTKGGTPRSWYAGVGKRIFDLAITVPTAFVLAPVALLVGVVIRAEDKGPAIFRQQRVGAGGRQFWLRKFRTMPVGTPHIPSGEAQSLTVTRTGRALRRTSLDEIPQLLSVLNGDMSLVGPRPALPQQEGLVELRTMNGALALKPGLTGLAQVNSYDGMTEAEKARWDGQYAHRISLRLDLWILIKTIGYLTRKPPQY